MYGKRRIFIGDIHGEYTKLKDLLEDLHIQPEDELIFLGDYIDRGKDSKGVLEILRKLKEKLPNVRLLWGNHELHLYEWLTENNPVYIETTEGISTLRNLVGGKVHFSDSGVLYGIPGDSDVKEEDIGFLTGHISRDYTKGVRNITKEVKEEVLETYQWLFDCMESEADYPEQVAVHGGLNFTKPDPIKDTSLFQKVNMRMFVSGSPLDKPIIIGHTPQKDITVTSDGKMVVIDTGCGSGGELSALIYYPEIGIYMDKDGREVLLVNDEESSTE